MPALKRAAASGSVDSLEKRDHAEKSQGQNIKHSIVASAALITASKQP